MKKRSHARKESKKEADILKGRGDEYFKIGNFTEAITYYT